MGISKPLEILYEDGRRGERAEKDLRHKVFTRFINLLLLSKGYECVESCIPRREADYLTIWRVAQIVDATGTEYVQRLYGDDQMNLLDAALEAMGLLTVNVMALKMWDVRSWLALWDTIIMSYYVSPILKIPFRSNADMWEDAHEKLRKWTKKIAPMSWCGPKESLEKGWKDGLFLTKLVAVLCPRDEFQIQSVHPIESRHNLLKAIVVAEHSLGVPQLLDESDFREDSIDLHSILIYLTVLWSRSSSLCHPFNVSPLQWDPHFPGAKLVGVDLGHTSETLKQRYGILSVKERKEGVFIRLRRRYAEELGLTGNPQNPIPVSKEMMAMLGLSTVTLMVGRAHVDELAAIGVECEGEGDVELTAEQVKQLGYATLREKNYFIEYADQPSYLQSDSSDGFSEEVMNDIFEAREVYHKVDVRMNGQKIRYDDIASVQEEYRGISQVHLLQSIESKVEIDRPPKITLEWLRQHNMAGMKYSVRLQAPWMKRKSNRKVRVKFKVKKVVDKVKARVHICRNAGAALGNYSIVLRKAVSGRIEMTVSEWHHAASYGEVKGRVNAMGTCVEVARADKEKLREMICRGKGVILEKVRNEAVVETVKQVKPMRKPLIIYTQSRETGKRLPGRCSTDFAGLSRLDMARYQPSIINLNPIGKMPSHPSLLKAIRNVPFRLALDVHKAGVLQAREKVEVIVYVIVTLLLLMMRVLWIRVKEVEFHPT